VRGRVAAGCAGLLLDVERALATTAAQCVRLVVALTEACRTLAYNLRPRRASVACAANSPYRYAPPRCTRQADVLLPIPPFSRYVRPPDRATCLPRKEQRAGLHAAMLS
jgi:hypothetical protein